MNLRFWELKLLLGLNMGIYALILPAAPLPALATKYKVEFQGVENIAQLRSLKEASSLIRYKKNPPRSLAALKYRAQHDIPDFLDVLHAYGYYDASIHPRALLLPSGRFKMLINVNKGECYRLSQFNFKSTSDELGQADEYNLQKIKLRELGIQLYKPALSMNIVEAEKELIALLNEHGHPFAKIENQEILVDQAQKTVSVNLNVSEGPLAYFGAVAIEGGGSVKQRYIKNRIAWKEGELYNAKKVAETEKNLYDSGLFSIVTVTHAEGITKNSTVPMKIELTGSKYNNLTLGGSYTTTWEGLGGIATWQNRNIFNLGLNLKLNYAINQKKQEAGLEFVFPDFFSAKNKLVAQSEVLIHNKMPTYQEKGVNTKVFVERIFSRYFKSSLGTCFDQFRTTDSLNNGYFSLVGIPFFVNAQSSDKVLFNPTTGGWASANITPYFSLISRPDSFTQVQLEGSVYQFIVPNRRVVLAMNMVFGTLFGNDLFDIPPPYRFYAGSPQHLRGYPYQKVSPLNSFGKELGGRSLFLWSIEPRVMIFKSFQIVGFFDVGNVYLNSWPDWKLALLKSVGVGVRYFSFVGPLRLDIGFPLDKISNDKRSYQIYFSIGQAF